MKKLIALIMSIVMITALAVAVMPAASAAWNGTSVSETLAGSGTEADPYLIANEANLAFVAKQVNEGTNDFSGQYIKLAVDLDLGNKAWTPIGSTTSNRFKGSFDGDGHTISNLSVKTSDGQGGGLFGYCKDMTIKNLTIKTAKVISANYGGAVVAHFECTAAGGSAAVINCHVSDAAVYGQQIGGVVGRSSVSNADKGQLKVIGCTADNISLFYLDANEYSVDFKFHFVGGIIGAAGATVIDGCMATNITGEIFANTMATAGGILGIQGANNVGTEVKNCYASDIKFTARADSNNTSTELGGLVGRLGHSANGVVYNCLVKNVELVNGTTSIALGIVTGYINSAVTVESVYYVPSGDLIPYGADKDGSNYNFEKVDDIKSLKAEKLNIGNSAAIWIDDAAKGHPVIDIAAAVAANVSAPDKEPETTAPDTTTAAPETTTAAPETTTVAIDVDGTPGPPSDTETPESDSPKSEGGCGSSIAMLSVAAILAGAACVVIKKKN